MLSWTSKKRNGKTIWNTVYNPASLPTFGSITVNKDNDFITLPDKIQPNVEHFDMRVEFQRKTYEGGRRSINGKYNLESIKL